MTKYKNNKLDEQSTNVVIGIDLADDTPEVLVGVEPRFANIPSEPELLANEIMDNEPKALTAQDVVNGIRDFIIKHSSIAQGKGYRAEYINYNSFVQELLNKLAQFEV